MAIQRRKKPSEFKRLRDQAGLTLPETADLLKVDLRTVYRYENGETRPTRLAKDVLRQAAELGVPMPISEEVAAVLFDGKDPRQAVEDLMTRLLREESEASPRSDVPPE